MSHSLPSSRIDLRALILYDIYQWKTIEKSYKNYEKLFETMGEKAISYDEFEYLHNEYLKESHYSVKNESGLSIPDIRGCILSDVIGGKSAERSYYDLSDAFQIDKYDHEYWFKRFENGQLFTRVTFSNLPKEIISEIVENCDLKTYLNLRNVSYGLRTIVDQTAPAFTNIYVECRDDRYEILNGDSFWFHFQWNYFQNILEKHQKLTFRDLEVILRNPKLRLKSFEIRKNRMFDRFQISDEYKMKTTRRDYTEQFIDLLNSLDHKIQVEKCSIRVGNEGELIKILQCFKPGTLETLGISAFRNYSIDKIVEMDQWKRAKHLDMSGFNLLSIDHFLHFQTINTISETVSMQYLVQLCNGLSESINFETCYLSTIEDMDTDAIERALSLQQSDSSGKFLIPNTNLVAQFLLPMTLVLKRCPI